MNANKPLEVLIVEDNPGDAFLISELLQDMGLCLNVMIAQNGQKALDILSKKDGHSSVPIPDFVILDLNLPKVHGFEVLAFLKSTPALRTIPVVVMTGSLNKEDELKARSMGVTDYCIKPSVESEFDTTCRWLRKSFAPLAGSDQKDCNRNGSSASMSVVTAKRYLNDRTAFGGGLPFDASGPGLGGRTFKPF